VAEVAGAGGARAGARPRRIRRAAAADLGQPRPEGRGPAAARPRGAARGAAVSRGLLLEEATQQPFPAVDQCALICCWKRLLSNHSRW
jgi:hypothetical protein